MWTIESEQFDPAAKTRRWVTHKQHTRVAEFNTFGALKRYAKNHALLGKLRAYENVTKEIRSLTLSILLTLATGCISI